MIDTIESKILRKHNMDNISFLKMEYVKCNRKAPPKEDSKGEDLAAFVNQKRWMVKCPHDNCNSACVVSKQQPIFLCTNGDCLDTCWHDVVFPEKAEAIEKILDKRPMIINRNWTTETIKDLQKENKDNGVI